MATLSEQASRLLDFNQDLDIPLESFVGCMYSGSGEQQQLAQEVLTSLTEGVLKKRWKTLPREQCEGIINHIVRLIIQISSKGDCVQQEKVLLKKLNIALVLLLAREWPKHWSIFISEIVGASIGNENICENSMHILKLLSEEVLNFPTGDMTKIKAKHLKDFMCSEFFPVFELWQFVLDTSKNAALVGATLETLLRFLSWMPFEYIIETKLIKTLISKFLNVPLYQNVTLKCLTVIVGLAPGPQYDDSFVALFSQTMLKIEQMLPLDTNIKEAFAMGNNFKQSFIQNLAIFLCTTLRKHRLLMERRELGNNLKALEYLLLISEVEEIETCKTCLKYWNTLVADLYHESNIPAVGVVGNAGGTVFISSVRRFIYKTVLSRLRYLIISRMVKPEDVLVVENERGEVVRDFMDSDSSDLYQSMRETLVYLTHLDSRATERIMVRKLLDQAKESEWSLKNLSVLCWAIGSVSGAMDVEDEKRLLVFVIKELLNLGAKKEGKTNKAIVASNLMYVIVQYPRLLRAHWKLLKNVVNKLFEFMVDTRDVIQEMACDYFIKIAQKCRRQIVQVREGEVTPFIEEIIENIKTITCELQPQQVLTFYEAVCVLISAETQTSVQETLIERLMLDPNQVWDDFINQMTLNVDVLKDTDAVKKLANFIQTNVRACKALGHPYVSQLGRIYPDMLNVYKVISENISGAITLRGENVTHDPLIKSMRLVKKETLKLISDWVSLSNDPDLVLENVVPPLLNAVLNDYQHCSFSSVREPEVLSTLATIVNKLEGRMARYVGMIFDAVFQCTLDMINKNFEEFPEHRKKFYLMLQAVNNHCFPALVNLPPAQVKLVIDTFIWALKQTMRNVADTGLDILYQFFQNVSQNESIAQDFYQAYYTVIIQHVFWVVTDSHHAASLTKHATILAYMFTIVEMGKVTVALNPAAQVVTRPEDLVTCNMDYICDFVAGLFLNAFPHLTEHQVKVTVKGLFNLDQDLPGFRGHLRDFLVQIKEFIGEDDSDLYYLQERELELRQAQENKRRVQMSVPGILNPQEIAEDMQG